MKDKHNEGWDSMFNGPEKRYVRPITRLTFFENKIPPEYFQYGVTPEAWLDCQSKALENDGTRYRLGVAAKGYVNAGGDRAALGIIQSYVMNMHKVLAKGAGLVLYGKNGGGKTSLAVMAAVGFLLFKKPTLLSDFSDYGFFVEFIRTSHLLDLTMMSRRKDDYHERREEFLETGLLVIDDLGELNFTSLDSVARQNFLDLVKERFNNNKITIITTNLTINEMHDNLGETLMDVILAKCEPIEVEGRTRGHTSESDGFLWE